MILSAQSFEETALLFSRITPGGSARMQSLGGAQISLGGDYSSSLSNPAGLGMYNRSEFAITPGFHLGNSSSEYLNTSTDATRSNLFLPGIGVTFYTDFNTTRGFLGGAFSISFNRVNDFNQNISYEGVNNDNSIIDYFIEQAWGSTINQFDSNGSLYNTPTHLAYNNYLIGPSTVIDPDADPTTYFTDVLGIPFQAETIQTRGGQNQWSFSYGVNFSDRLFLGAGVGLTSLRYESSKSYREAFQNEPLLDLHLKENLEIKGSGINATIGMIYRPIDIIQFGFAATTPTHYELTDVYTSTMSSNWDNFMYDPSTVLNYVEDTNDPLTSEYVLNTPGKVSMGVTGFIGKFGFISADIERVNYSNAKYKSGENFIEFDGENDAINSLYQPVYNLRFGAEARIDKFRVRAGYNHMPEPFKATQNNADRTLQSFTGGLGYRDAKFYIDLAAAYRLSKTPYRPYTVNNLASPLVINNLENTNFIVTLGFPF
jgi:hypothetical protein